MNTSRSSAFALALMQRAGVDEALAGDIAETYSRSRSSAWLLWQTAAAVASSTGSDLRRHKLLMVRAVVVGWIVYRALEFYVLPYQHILLGDWMWRPQVWLGHATGLDLPLIDLVDKALTALVVGYAIARTHRGHGLSMSFAFVCSLMLILLGGVLSSALHGGRGPAGFTYAFLMIFAFVVVPCCVFVGASLAPTRSPEDVA